MSLDFSKLRLIGIETNMLVFGYIHQLKLDESKSKNLLEIPTEIANICILFVEHVCLDSFGRHGKNIFIRPVTYHYNYFNVAEIFGGKSYSSLHGIYEIDCGLFPDSICEWTLRIRSFNTISSAVSVGLDSDRKRTNINGYCFGKESNDNNPNRCFYALSNGGYLEYADNNNQNVWWYKPKTKVVLRKTSEKIKMIFSVKQKSLQFIIGAKDIGILYDNIDTTKVYHLALSILCDCTPYVELVKFHKTYSCL